VETQAQLEVLVQLDHRELLRSMRQLQTQELQRQQIFQYLLLQLLQVV
jgi:hypothetical protein